MDIVSMISVITNTNKPIVSELDPLCCLYKIKSYFYCFQKNMKELKPWDKVRYTQDYLDYWERVADIPYPFQDTYTVKKQITRTAYFADGEKKENKRRIIHPWGMEKIEQTSD